MKARIISDILTREIPAVPPEISLGFVDPFINLPNSNLPFGKLKLLTFIIKTSKTRKAN